MSLFENEQYRWRETYFVLFQSANRPAAKAVRKAFRQLGDQCELTNVRVNPDGALESCTLVSPDDFAAMDITYLGGEEVVAQVEELRQDMKGNSMTPEERAKFDRLRQCDARFDIYHFEQIVDDEGGEENDDYLDPGALLIVIEQLARVCQGVGIDPQSGAVM